MDRRSRDEAIPEEIERLFSGFVAEAVSTGEILSIYDAAVLLRLSLDNLGREFLATAQAASNVRLAIEALRKSLVDAGAAST